MGTFKTNFLNHLFNGSVAIGISICLYLSFTVSLGREGSCFTDGCSSLPFIPTPLGIPVSTLGIFGWLISLCLLRLGESIGKAVTLTFTILCWLLILYAVLAAHAWCFWCILHAASVTTFFISQRQPSLPTWASLAVGCFFGIGLAIVSPRAAGYKEISANSDEKLQSVSIEFLKGHSKAGTVYALLDLNCGHCVHWLQQVISNPRTARKSLRIVFANTTPVTAPYDANVRGDSLANRIDLFKEFIADGATVHGSVPPSAPGPQLMLANSLYRTLRLKSVPVFFLSTKPRRMLDSSSALEEIFGSKP